MFHTGLCLLTSEQQADNETLQDAINVLPSDWRELCLFFFTLKSLWLSGEKAVL